MPAIPKDVEYRNAALVALARDQHCANCGSTHGVVSAHSNWAEHGKGKSRKAHDCFVAWLCWACHTWLDQVSNCTDPTERFEPTREDKYVMWWESHKRTRAEMFNQGLIRGASEVEVLMLDAIAWLEMWRAGLVQVTPKQELRRRIMAAA